MAGSSERLLELANRVHETLGTKRVEFGQAQAAINEKFREETEAHVAAVDTEASRVDLQTKVAALNAESSSEEVEAMVETLQTYLFNFNIHLIEASQAAEAAVKAVQEIAESDAASFDYESWVTELKQAAADYTLED